MNTYGYVYNPNESIDPFGLAGCARALGRAMIKANKNLAQAEGYMARAWNKVKGSAAHHIVAWDDPRAEVARKILGKHDIHIDSAANGIFLKHMDPKSIQPGAYHRIIHTDKYYRDVVTRLTSADKIGGKQGVLDELRAISDDLLFNKKIW